MNPKNGQAICGQTLSEHTQFKPVQSGNPGGRDYVEEIKKFLEEDDGARFRQLLENLRKREPEILRRYAGRQSR